MKLDNKIFYSKIARRIFLIFIGCAMLPVIVLTVISFNQVTSSLRDQAIKRLRHLTKAEGMTIYDRLLLLDTNLKIIAADFDPVRSSYVFASKTQQELLGQWFKGCVYLDDSGVAISVFKDITPLPDLTKIDLRRQIADKTLIFSQPTARNVRIFMVKKVGMPGQARVLLMEVNTAFLWGIGSINTVPQQTRLCVFDQSMQVLLDSFDEEPGGIKKIRGKLVGAGSRTFEFNYQRTTYIASSWTVFMSSGFVAPQWIVVLAQDKADVLAPLEDFKDVFPLVILLSFLIVLLLSISYIRKSLVPLEQLKEGADRLARRDFGCMVEVDSDDEFAELAAAFNAMAAHLSRQFDTINVMGEIDRAILSSMGTSDIVDKILMRINDLMDCRTVCIALSEKDDNAKLLYFIHDRQRGRKTLAQNMDLTDAQKRDLLNEEVIVVNAGQETPSYIEMLVEYGSQSFVVIPLIIRARLAGIFVLGFADKTIGERGDDIANARHLAAQMSVALANAYLIEDLEGFSWGAIEALGRAVDAKSSWTAGHSERVTSYAVQIAQALSLPEERQRLLQRAALLHDIGKIGISVQILDKPGRLTDEEFTNITCHPSMGAKILEPIAAFQEIIPIIAQHHENYDGSGYPEGLKGGGIRLEARILAVADVFDALVSVRPYRDAWSLEKVTAFFNDNSGKKFDPALVSVFLNLLEQDILTVKPLRFS